MSNTDSSGSMRGQMDRAMLQQRFENMQAALRNQEMAVQSIGTAS
jgi:hypothetical protein